MANGLFEAVTGCHFKQLQFLVESGLSVNHKNASGLHTLVAALQIDKPTKRERMLRYLIRHKANCRAVDSETGRDVFTWACFLGRTTEAQLVMRYVEDDFDFHKKDVYGRTALHYATMRGNADLVTFICNKMAKYELTVDVRDDEGFTPFLIAKRLGFDDCANVLLSVGMASPYQFDQKQRKMGHDWEAEGVREHFSNLSQTNRKKVSMYKTLGRLPELRRASFDSSKVKVVKSRKDRKFLANSDPVENPLTHRDLSDFSRAATKNAKRSVSLNDLTDVDGGSHENTFTLQFTPRHMTTRSSSPPLESAAELQRRTDSSLRVPSTDEALRLINLNTPQFAHAHDTESSYSSPPSTFRNSITESLPELMTILEQQTSHAYRPKAKPPARDVSVAPRPNQRSTMAIIFGKDGSMKIVKKELPAPRRVRNGRLSSIKEELHAAAVHSKR